MVPFSLCSAVTGSFFPSAKFKTEKLSLYFYLPLAADTMPALCLLGALLPDGCEAFPHMRDMSRECDRLYGASINSEASKLGDALVLRFSVVHLSDCYTEQGVAKQARKLLLDTIFRPAFSQDSFETEKRLQLDEIESLINNKRAYSMSKCTAAMYPDSPFGLTLPGTAEQVQALTLDDVKAAWRTMLETAYVRISHTAAEQDPSVFDAVCEQLSHYDRSRAAAPALAGAQTYHDTVQRIDEHLPVAQGKLVLGFKTDVLGSDADTYKLMLMTDILGGGTYSLLFNNVREKMSLCYYCAARAVRRKGVVTVESGVEFANMDKAERAILDQLDALRRGDFADEILQNSKSAILQSLESIDDSQTVTDRWYADRLFDEPLLTPDQLGQKLLSVTKQDVVDMANTLRLDTVYRLLEV